MPRIMFPIALVTVHFSICFSAEEPSNNKLPIGSRLEMFVDDWLIDHLSGAERRLHHPVPREVALVFDRPWGGNFSAAMSVLRTPAGLQ